MQADQIPAVLSDRLGPEAAGALADFVDAAFDEQRTTMIDAVTERFERRMVEELAAVRLQLAHVEGSLRQEIAGVRQDMAQSIARLREDMAAGRVELFKWSFLFWIGQVLALAGFFAVALRALRP